MTEAVASPGEARSVDSQEFETLLRRHVIDVWFPRSLDTEHGGFLCVECTAARAASVAPGGGGAGVRPDVAAAGQGPPASSAVHEAVTHAPHVQDVPPVGSHGV